jgi:hypothetical protein
MNNQNQENLKELFEKSLDTKQAQKYVEDVQKTEEILREHPAPEPDDMFIANIKAEIAMRLPVKRTYVFNHIAYNAIRITAVVIFITGIDLRLFDNGALESGLEVWPL